MKCCKRIAFLRAAACVALVLLSPVPALGGNGSVPDIDRLTFDAALAEDRLTLKPVEDLGFDPAVSRPLSISPDGTKLLLFSEEGLYVLSSGETLALVPQAGDSNLTEERILQQFEQVEAGGIAWSPDGTGLMLNFPGHVYRYARFDANIWAANFESGDVIPLFTLPLDFFKDFQLAGFSVPVRSAFDPDGSAFYYECFADDPADDKIPRKNYYYRCDPTTKERSLLGFTPFDMASGDGSLWATDGRLVTTVASIRGPKGGAGMAVLSPGRAAEMTLEREGVLAEFLHGSRLIAWHGDTGVLLCLSSGYNVSFMPHLMEFRVTEQGRALWNRFILLMPDLPAGERLTSVDADALHAEEERENYAKRVAQGEVLAPCNAAYSPDGGYLLLGAIDRSRNEAALYIQNLATGACGRVTLPEGMEADTFAYGYGPNRLPGMIWAGNNRLLLRDGDAYRLFALAF